MPIPLKRSVKVKKHTKSFLRHQGDMFKRLSWDRKGTWRRPRGIDSRVRRRFKSNVRTVKIGFGTAAAQRHVLPCGFKKFAVSNVKDLDVLLMHNRVYAAEIAHNVSAKKRVEIVKRAAQLDVRVLNGKARIVTEESA